jgi:hypothetical protein
MEISQGPPSMSRGVTAACVGGTVKEYLMLGQMVLRDEGARRWVLASIMLFLPQKIIAAVTID